MSDKTARTSFFRVILYVLIASVFFFSFGLAGRYPFNYITIALWLLLGGFYFLCRRLNRIKLFKFRIDLFAIAVTVYCLALLLSYALSGFTIFSKSGIVCALSGLLLYWMCSDGLISKRGVLSCACLGAVAYLLLFAIVYRSDILHPNFSSRIGAFFDNANEVGLNTALCSILLFGFGLASNNWFLKIGCFFFSFLSFYFILLTGSVSTTLTLSFALLVAIPFYFKKHRWIVSLLEALVVGLGLFCVFTLPSFSYYASRIRGMLGSLGLENNTGDASAEMRFISIIAGLRIFLNNPLFGAGNDAVVRSYTVMSHNNFAEVLADYGIFAFIAYEATMIVPLSRLKNTKEPYKNMVLPLLVFCFVFQFFLFTFDSKCTSLIIATCFYLVFPEGCYTNGMKRRRIKCTRIEI